MTSKISFSVSDRIPFGIKDEKQFKSINAAIKELRKRSKALKREPFFQEVHLIVFATGRD